MININLHLRDLTANTPQKIWAVFFYEKNRIKIDTNQFILPKNWSKSQQKALPNYEDSAKLNKLLKEKKQIIEDYTLKSINKLKMDKMRFYKDTFQPAIQAEFNRYFKIGENLPQKENEIVDFVSFIQDYIKNRKNIEEGSRKVMRQARNHIFFAFNLIPQKMKTEYIKMSNYKRRQNLDFLQPNKQIDFDQIDYNFFLKLNDYLLNATYTEKKNGVETTLNYCKNTIAKAIKNTMQFANEAVKAGYIHNLSYKGFTTSKEDADNIHLTWEEIEKLKALELPPESLKGRVRNLFVFNCYCGLRYSDLNRLDKSSFTRFGGQLRLKIRMKKVDTIVMFPIVGSAEDIMKIYDYNLPKVLSVHYNEEIKKICKMAGIINLETKRETRGGSKIIQSIPKYQMVSSHTARRSFATNFYEDGVKIAELMAITGHTSEKAFKNYVKSKPENTFSEFLAVGANR